jgi:RNA polymerase sigma-70 factor (ECF subfamily)
MSSVDDPLIQRLRQGDREALADLLVARRAPLLGYINSQLGIKLRRKVEADDIFQDVSAEAVRAFDATDFESLDPFGWLCQLAQRRIIDAHRRYFGAQRRTGDREVGLHAGASDTRGAGLVNMLIASMTSPSAVLSRDQRFGRMYSAIAQLPPDQSEVLRLRYLEGLPSKQVAEQIGKSDGAVRVMISRALNQLRKIMAETESRLQ